MRSLSCAPAAVLCRDRRRDLLMANASVPPLPLHVVVPFELSAIAKRVEHGERPTATVRAILSWFSQKRRGYWVVNWVREALDTSDLITVPDFAGVWIDSEVAFLPKQVSGAAATSA